MRAPLVYRLAFAVMTLVTGCSETATPTSPSNEPRVINKPGEFRFQSRPLSATTRTFSYVWLARGTNIHITQIGRIETGEAHVKVSDPRGTGLMSRLDTPEFWLMTGLSGFPRAAGTWHIDVQLDAVTGIVDYHVTGDPLP